jgi:hypothetical protein
VSSEQASKSEISRLQNDIGRLETSQKMCQDATSVVARHWTMLVEELRSTFQRLEHKPTDLGRGNQSQIFDGILTMQV